MTQRRWQILALAGLLGLAAIVGWRALRPRAPSDTLTLYGNVDLRQVELAFNGSDRIAAVEVQEGDRLVKGEVVARLDTSRLAPEVERARAEAAAQAEIVAKMRAGNRPQEIAEARAQLDVALADATNAATAFRRASGLWDQSPGGAAVSRQDVDNARAAMDAAKAKVEAQRSAYELERAGFRREDIAQATAQLEADEAQLALLRQQLADAALASPVNGVVRARLMEPGEMASPQRPVLAISETDPKWVRAYVSEVDLARVHPGAPARVTVDAFPRRAFKGWVGFISSEAEFTPKTVQTPELRTSLVYEVRVFVTDPGDDLRLGMPATVVLKLAPPGAAGR